MIKMKKIYSILIILIAGITISCNKSSSDDTPTGYVNPGFTPRTDLSADKGYIINSAGTLYSCGSAPASGEACRAVIYQGTLNDTPYIGIAVDDTGFKLKIYWSAEDIPTDTTEISNDKYTIKVTAGSNNYNSIPPDNIKASSLKIKITSPTTPEDKIYIIDFTDDIIINGTTIISNGDQIKAYKY
jgi:hypothetical protein